MDLTHDFVVPLDVPTAWDAFNDLERIAPCFPGAAITSVDGDDFTGTAKVKLGPISLQYTGSGRFVERDEAARRAVINASGKDKRGNGTAAATITAHLEEVPQGTKVVVETDLKITGRPAQFGRGVIGDVGGKILDQFAQCLAATLGQEAGEAASPGEAAVPGAPTAAGEAPAAAAASPGEAAVPGAPAAAGEAAGEAAASPGEAAVPGAPAAGTGDGTRGAAARAPGGAPAAPPSGRPSTPPPRPLAPQGAAAELDLGAVVLPTLLRRYGPTALACAVTALITWWVARR